MAGTYFGVILIRGLWELSTYLATWTMEVFPEIPGHVSGDLPTILIATVIILFIIFEPRGLNHRWLIFKESYRLWPWAYW